jgi:hypothetical protein
MRLLANQRGTPSRHKSLLHGTTPAGRCQDILAPGVDRSHVAPRRKGYDPFAFAVEKRFAGDNERIRSFTIAAKDDPSATFNVIRFQPLSGPASYNLGTRIDD